ncbi:YidC/Oxa1 family membrane protein insertase [Fusibacter sp. JL216-2]|uniref:YidC/Oxa1 family membrane protein insertase n=1 Tax=Fusibacter sp. JL216-2 TaxID=3071453 RepID=UPI003D349B25
MDFIYQGLGALLGGVYSFVGSYWFSIVIFTIIVKVLLVPLSFKQIQSTKAMNDVQPKLKKLQEKYKDDKETLNIKMMELYKEHNINPLAGCLPLLIQMPILFGLFRVLREPVNYVFGGDATLASEALNQTFLWISDISVPDSIGALIDTGVPFINGLPGVLPILAALTTYISMALTTGKQQQANQQMQTMQMMMPLMILWFGASMSAGLMIYWIVSNVFQMGQQYIVPKLANKEAA